MPAVAMFYHLIQHGLPETLDTILARALGQDWRVMIRCPDPDLAQRLDDALWLPDDSFVPHGQAKGTDQDGLHPVLIGPGPIANAAKGLMLVAGAQLTGDDLPGLERIWILFDGSDAAAVAAARTQWLQSATFGLAAQYWADDTGSWVKKTERPAG